MSKLHIKKGDTVYVLSGDDRGQQGRVLKVEVAKQRAIVEGVNMCVKATKPSAQHPQGGLIKKRGPHPHLESCPDRSEERQAYPHRPSQGRCRQVSTLRKKSGEVIK